MRGGGNDAAGKPSLEELGVDVATVSWQRSGEAGRGEAGGRAGGRPDGEGAIEVAFVHGPAGLPGDWVLMRVAGDPARRVLVYDRHEWECFLDGVRKGEFDDAAG